MAKPIAITMILLVLTVACISAWAAVRAITSPFIVPSAVDVQVHNNGFGERVITYRMPNPDDGWQTYVARSLTSNGWGLTRDGTQWGGTETIVSLGTYTKTRQFWFFTLYERAELQGNRSEARIIVQYVVTRR